MSEPEGAREIVERCERFNQIGACEPCIAAALARVEGRVEQLTEDYERASMARRQAEEARDRVEGELEELRRERR